MSENVNKINKISVDSSLEIKNVNMTMLLFSDNLLSPKTGYTIADNMLILKDQAQSSLNLFQFTDSSRYYEYLVNLRISDAVISGMDRYGNRLSNVSDVVLVFVNGYKLSSSEYKIDVENETITIPSCYTEKTMSNVIIYTSSDLVYEGNVEDDFSWDSNTNEFTLKDYSIERYVFFKNGELLPPNKIQKVGSHIRLNTTIKHGVDLIEYYRMTKGCCALTFTPSLGYLTYGPKDDRGTLIQNPYDCIILFDNVAKLVVDNIRPGFFVYEDGTDGCVMITDDDFEKRDLKCLIIKEFHNSSLSSSEYFLTVPNAPSILKYVSEYDLNGTLFKELLASFQKVLLNETYDTVQRLKDIRNINKVDSSNINALINFLGLKINVTNLTLAKKHNLIEELRSFYNVVGTRASYNFYNGFKDEGKILNIEQLFTPIKSNVKEKNQQSEEEHISSFFPEEYGELLDVKQIVIPTRNSKSYEYSWLLRFVNGYLPVIVENGDDQPIWQFDMYTNSLHFEDGVLDDRIDCIVYSNSYKKLIYAISGNTAESISYFHNNGIIYKEIPWTIVERMNWDEGHKNGGTEEHPYYSPTTKRYDFSISNGIFTVVDTYTGHTLGSWTYYTNKNLFFPKEYGKLLRVEQTLALESDRVTYGYVWSFHFENGILPAIIHKDQTYPEFDFSRFEYNAESLINSAVYELEEQRWKNAIAEDGTDLISWKYKKNDGYKYLYANYTQEIKTSWWKWSGRETLTNITTYKSYITNPDYNIPLGTYGDYIDNKCTVSLNESCDDYVYTLSLHFQYGTLGIRINRDQDALIVNPNFFIRDSNSSLNSMVYDMGVWYNAIAKDESSRMIWKDHDGTILRSLTHEEASAMDWNDGHNTVDSNDVSCIKENDKLFIYKKQMLLGVLALTSGTTLIDNNSNWNIPYTYGEFLFSRCTVTPDPSDSRMGPEWFVLSLHFKNGIMPLRVYRDSTDIVFDKTCFTQNTNHQLTSLAYNMSTGEWWNTKPIPRDYEMWWCIDDGKRYNGWVDLFPSNQADYSYPNWRGYPYGESNCLDCRISDGVMTILKNGEIIGTLTIQPRPTANTIFVEGESDDAPVYDSNLEQIGTLTSYSSESCVFNGSTYSYNSQNNIEITDTQENIFYKYTEGEPVTGGQCYDDTDGTNGRYYSNPTNRSFNLDGVTYSVIEKNESSETIPGLDTVFGDKYEFTIINNVVLAQEADTHRQIGSWTFYVESEEEEEEEPVEETDDGGEVSDPIRRYVTFRTAEELGAVEKRKFVTDSVDFGQVSELAVQGGVNLSNTPRYEGVLKYSDYPVLINGTLDRYHPTDSGPVLSTDSISLSIIVNSIVRMTKVTNDNDYEMVVDISAYPLDLRVELHDRDGRNLRVYGYVEETNTYTFLLEESSAYHYNILDKNGNKLFSNNLEYGDHTVTTTLPLVNNYITDPKMGPNEATIDCGYITEEPVDFYDFGSVSDDIPGHWVTWYEWDRPKNWYPTNHVDVSVDIPVNMDYETFMNSFKDTFYDMASAVLYIHQITQIYMFGDPNNDGSEPIQPMNLITTLPYSVETQCFTNDHEFLPYKKAVSNKPLKELKAYMFKNPTYEFVESYSNNITGTSINLKEFFPEEWGKLNEVKQTVAPNETNDGYLFTWSLHFDNGTLPVVVDKNTLVPNWNLTLFTSDTNPQLNGCCYRHGEWINTVASDEGDYMLWKASNGSSVRSLNYISATAMNWYVYNNRITVHSHKFNFTITDDLLIIGDVEIKTNKSLKVSVDLYKNYGRDEDLYNQTGEERDIEWTETLTGTFPCEQLNYTYWSSEQDESTMPVSGDVSYEKSTSIPMFTVTCTPNENRTSLLYALVINYDDREEAYIIDKTLQIVTKLNVPSQIKKLQTVIDDEIVYVRPNSVFYENGTWSLGYLTYDEEFDTFEWKAPTLTDDYPQDEHEPLDTGLGGFILENASSYNWNGGKLTNPIVDSRSEVRNAKLYISIDTGENPYIYKEINSAFNLNEYVGEYSKPYSYSHNNITWSCNLTKYRVYNAVTLKDSSIETNASTLLLPTNILYSDGNNGLNYNFQTPPYTFSTLEPQWNQVDEETTEEGKKEYWKYTNNFASNLNQTSISFSTYGTVFVSSEVVIRNVDYVVLKYRWFSGEDLDSLTYITNAIGSMASSINNVKVGYIRNASRQYVPSKNNYLLWWGDDNRVTGEENILLNIKNMKDYYSEYIPELLNIEMDACWFSIVSQTQPIIEVTGYKGGTMSHSGYQFVNNGGEMVAQQTIQAVNMSTTTIHEYRNVANVKYNKDTETFTLTITDRYEETTPDLDEVANLLGE